MLVVACTGLPVESAAKGGRQTQPPTRPFMALQVQRLSRHTNLKSDLMCPFWYPADFIETERDVREMKSA